MKDAEPFGLKAVAAALALVGFCLACTWLTDPPMIVPVGLMFAILLAGWSLTGVIWYGLIKLGVISYP